MYSKALVLVISLAMISAIFGPVFAWEYPDGTSDTKYESFGPRADNLLINLYYSDIMEWEGTLGGDLDLTDSPLWGDCANWFNDPSRFNVLTYGEENDICVLSLNNNNNTELAPGVPNPVYPNPMGYTVDESGVLYDNGYGLRHAIAHLVNRDAWVSDRGVMRCVPAYTVIPSVYHPYDHEDVTPGGALEDLTHPYDPVVATGILNATGMFPIGGDGWRYWDRNHNGQNDNEQESLMLKFVYTVEEDYPVIYSTYNPYFDPADSEARKSPSRSPTPTGSSEAVADLTPQNGSLVGPAQENEPVYRLIQELEGIKIHVDRLALIDRFAVQSRVMGDKDFHISPRTWKASNPDFLSLWHWDYFLHPGKAYNYAGCNKDAFNGAASGLSEGSTQDDAIYWARIAQEVYADAVLGIPVYSSQGSKVMSKTYTGSGSQHGEYWNGAINEPHRGIDNKFTFLNMHTQNHPTNGTINYGSCMYYVHMLNPIYAASLLDNRILDLIGYESLLQSNPYSSNAIPWVARNFTTSSYFHPTYTSCVKAVFTLRNDIFFQDGHQLTTEDVYFTLVELKDILKSRGLPPPWWISNVQNILSFEILDAFNFEVLLDTQSIFSICWVGQNRILPKHIWKPICESTPLPGKDPWAITTVPDPNLIGSGPWRLAYYPDIGNGYVLLCANTPGSTIDTHVSHDYASSQPITSPKGYFRLNPVNVNIHADGEKSRIDPIYPNTNTTVDFRIGVTNQWLTSSIDVQRYVYLDGSLVIGATNLAINSNTTHSQSYQTLLVKGNHTIKVAVRITSACAWQNRWINLSLPLWITIPEDIKGSYYVDTALWTPDCKVDLQDVYAAGWSFGAVPGDPKWNRYVDINHDYKVDLKDYFAIAKKYGKW